MNQEDKLFLLKLARESIETSFKGESPNINQVSHLNEKQGVFVTLHKNKQLRGCIGFLEPIMPLYEAVIDAARQAAFNDNRFSALTKDELKSIHIELSVLTVPQLIEIDDSDDYKKKIVIGEDGLIIKSKRGSGLLLPQVATDYNFTSVQFLNALCQKAGLPFHAWQDIDNCEIYKFQAEIFSE